MQFNSYLFILLFLPVFVVGFYILSHMGVQFRKLFIIAAGVVFYVYGGWNAACIFGMSIVLNLVFSVVISHVQRCRKIILVAAVLSNIALLLYYKYFNFVILTVNGVFHESFNTRELILPIGISFFTFQQIIYVVSVYRKEIEKLDIIDYLAYILYFPKLVMGPLVDASDFIHQLNDTKSKIINWGNIAGGLKLFSFGLFKKMVLADTFCRGVFWGFTNLDTATAGDFFLVTLFYTFEIYFDFSGYTDMATGISDMVNISLPMNFDSPYKAFSIRDFWKRWHMSLTNFFTKYVYFSLGGGRKGKIRTYINIMVVFFVSGLWHGANWTFLLWGCIHGLLQVFERIFEKSYSKLHDAVKWGCTFFTVNLLWLLFRAETVSQWLALLTKMFTFQNMSVSDGLINSFVLPENTFLIDILGLTDLNGIVRGLSMLVFIIFAFLICLIPENNYRDKMKLNIFNMTMCAAAVVWGILCLSSESVFVYFNF